MSCSVKISCGKSWSGSQRRISSLVEEAAAAVTASSTTSTIYPSPGGFQGSSLTSTATTATTAGGATLSSGTVTTSSTATTTTNLPAGQRIVPPRPVKSIVAKKGEDATKLLKYIDDNVIGRNGTFFGPFGRRKVVYCDYTASGRSLQFLEEYIAKEVLPYLGDTRASTSICSLQTSLFRHEARDILRHAVGASEQDAVLFTGQGTAAALRTLLRHLDPSKSTVVFVGPFEHHGNLRPWREYGVKIVRVSETREGFLDLNDLERGLARVRAEGVAQIIGCFSAASCITGVLADDVATTLLLHQYGALSVWDYTTAAPYIQIDMNPNLPGVEERAVQKDAIIFAGHKFIGGLQSPGVLVTKKSLLKNDVSLEDMRDSHRYLRDPELREESGTAGVVETIRCGLAVQLKENVTPRAIVARQDKISKQVLAHVRTIPELILLGSGSQNVKRLPIFSFMVRHPRGTFLHHNFVCAVLNDVFGIQARAGCACAGRYAHDLMGIDQELAREYEDVILEECSSSNDSEMNSEALRPGFAKLSFPYFMSEAEVAFVMEALKMVATEGWKLLPQYILNPDTGEWRHHTNSVFKERKWLGSIRYTDGRMVTSERRVSGAGIFPQGHADCLQTARNIFNRARKMAQRCPLQIDRNFEFTTERNEALRWFMLPSEAQDLLLGNSQNVKQEVPFSPVLAWNRYGYSTPPMSMNGSVGNTHESLANYLTLTNGIRRLNSDIPRTGNAVIAPNSPRHRSLPVLGRTGSKSMLVSALDDGQKRTGPSISQSTVTDNEDDAVLILATASTGHRSPATCPSSPMPVRFAVGEVVTPSALGAMPRTTARSIKNQNPQQQHERLDILTSGRARCNSLGSTTPGNCENKSSSFSSTGSTVFPSSAISPLPLSPQTLTSLGLSTANTVNTVSRYRRLHCSCSSQTELNSLELDCTTGSPSHSISSFNCHAVASPPSSFSSASDYAERMAIGGAGRSSPVSTGGQSTEDDLRAYVKEVTKELATEIKSEIREVISKVDDALSESNTSDTNGQHPARVHANVTGQNSMEERQNRHDSFTASDIAEYLMEFSKEMASEVKSEIRCVVNAVDGLHRYSPEVSTSDISSNGCGSPISGRINSSSTASPRLSASRRHRSAELPGKVSELSHQESKMSSECSSDETVIYVMKPTVDGDESPTEASLAVATVDANKSNEEEEEEEEEEIVGVRDVDEDTEEDGLEPNGVDIGEARKILPKIYSAVNSVSSQDSGINLSFHESDKSSDSAELKRSSSAESTSNNGAVGKSKTNPATTFIAKPSTVQHQRPGNFDFSEDEESVDLKTEEQTTEGNTSLPMAQWHCPPKNVWKPTVEAMQEFDMIRDNDRVLVCLSMRGKGSLSLLHTLHQYRFYARSKGIDFEIGAATIDDSSISHDPLCCMAYLKALDVPYFYEDRTQEIISTSNVADEQTERSSSFSSSSSCSTSTLSSSSSSANEACSFCDRTVRSQLYALAKRNGYNVLALGQHLDDLTEGFLVSVFHGGKLRTMKAHYYIRKQDLRVIRPFVYVREKALRQFADTKKLLAFRGKESTTNSLEKQSRSKEIVVQQELAHPRLYWSVRNALRPLIVAQGQTVSGDASMENIANAATSGLSIGGAVIEQGQQKRHHRRPKIGNPSSANTGTLRTPRQDEEDEETDEEPVL